MSRYFEFLRVVSCFQGNFIFAKDTKENKQKGQADQFHYMSSAWKQGTKRKERQKEETKKRGLIEAIKATAWWSGESWSPSVQGAEAKANPK